MPKLIFIDDLGERVEVDARVGDSVMRAAKLGDVAGIVGECGGSMTCLTCHCFVDSAHRDRIPEASTEERQMLECLLEQRENSRLSCQIVVTERLEGMRFDLPAWQG
jgi:2Fe-2S ferredoxin